MFPLVLSLVSVWKLDLFLLLFGCISQVIKYLGEFEDLLRVCRDEDERPDARDGGTTSGALPFFLPSFSSWESQGLYRPPTILLYLSSRSKQHIFCVSFASSATLNTCSQIAT